MVVQWREPKKNSAKNIMRNISIGIDIGTRTTRVVVGEFQRGEKPARPDTRLNESFGQDSVHSGGNPKIIGVGEAPTRGLRHGYVSDFTPAVDSVKKAVAMAEKSSGMKIKRAFVGVSGTSLRGESSSGSAIISKADGEVTTLDINKALEDAEDNLNLNNKKVIQVYPISYRLDGKDVQGRLEGMRGTKLEVKALFVTYSIQHLEDLVGVIASAGVETIDVIATPIALSHIVLTERQKIVGVALVDIGAETTSLAVFENGTLTSIQTFSIGSANITNDIALGLKISLDEAENLKLGNTEANFSKKKLEEIIEARLTDIFESVENHLRKIKRAELLPAGVIFVGGGANTFGLLELSRSTTGSSEIFGNAKTKLRDASWFTALGLIISGKDNSNYSDNSFVNLFKDLKSALKSSARQLMP